MKGRISLLAIGMVVLYAALMVGASGCLFLHAEQSGPVHHHDGQSHVTHSALCAWACQINPTVIVHTVVPLGAVFALVAMLWLVGVTPHTGLFAATFRSRAPPR
jgi:hypothetical protein